jgi:hypothetical protein
MADPTQLTADQFLPVAKANRIPVLAGLLEAEAVPGPRVVFSGLLPTKEGVHAWVWPDGLCFVSAKVFEELGGNPNA